MKKRSVLNDIYIAPIVEITKLEDYSYKRQIEIEYDILIEATIGVIYDDKFLITNELMSLIGTNSNKNEEEQLIFFNIFGNSDGTFSKDDIDLINECQTGVLLENMIQPDFNEITDQQKCDFISSANKAINAYNNYKEEEELKKQKERKNLFKIVK